MLGRRRTTTTLVLVTAVLAGCGAEREAPVAARPVAAPTTEPATPVARRTTTTTSTTTTTTESRRVPKSTTTPEPSATTSSTVAETTTTMAPTTTAAPTTTMVPTTTVASQEPAWAAFDVELAARLIGRGDYAASVAVAKNGEMLHTGVYGVRVPPPPPAPALAVAPPVPGQAPPPTEVAPAPPAAPPAPLELADQADKFRIASISKVITAIVVLQLVDDGRLALDEPVGDRLAQQVGAMPVDLGVGAITVRQLLSHTAGFPSYQRTFFGGSVDSCPTVANLGLSAPLQSPPGIAYEYSNLNYCLLGLLVEQVTGRPYEQVVRERLLAPLGITGMRLAGTFDVAESEILHPSGLGRNYMEVLGAAGSWVASPTDVVAIIDSLDVTKPGFHPLQPATVELMRQPAPPPVVYGPDRWYGLGLIVYVDGAWGHTGTIENTHAMVLRRPDGVTWSVLVSGETPWNTDNLRRIFDEAIVASGVIL